MKDNQYHTCWRSIIMNMTIGCFQLSFGYLFLCLYSLFFKVCFSLFPWVLVDYWDVLQSKICITSLGTWLPISHLFSKLNLSCHDGKAFSTYEKDVMVKQGITNMLALPIDKMLYIYLVCPHSEHKKKIHFNLNSLNAFTKKIDSCNVKPVLIR